LIKTALELETVRGFFFVLNLTLQQKKVEQSRGRMIKFKITNEMIAQAKREAAEYQGSFSDKRSIIKNGGGTTAGIISEIHFGQHFKDAIRTQEFSHDFILNGKKIEIKSVRRTVDPEPHFIANNATTSDHQKGDDTYLVFYSLNHKTKFGTMCGYINSLEFYAQAIFHPKGEVVGLFEYKTNTWTIPYNKLKQF
jgi:hypothetical protein